LALVEVPELEADASVGLLVRSALARSVAQLQQREPGVRRGDDPEDVHKYRVATRRLRSDLRTFSPLLERPWRRRLRTELKWIAAEVGAVRDADVLLGRLAPRAGELPGPLADEAGPLLLRLSGERALAHAALLDTLGMRRYERLVDALVTAAAQPRLAAGSDDERPGGEVVAGLVREPWDDLRSGVDGLGDDPSDHALHEVRILAKRCRYAAEAVAPVAGEPAGLLATALADLQTVLGDHQDTVVAEEWLAGAAAHLPGSRDAADALVEQERSQRHTLRQAWPAAWQAVVDSTLRVAFPT
jgi:CHAD domain-containing protein